jgi:hypothetical protein
VSYRITYNSGDTEEVAAGDYRNAGPWVIFYDTRSVPHEPMLQVKAAAVKRVERINEPAT